jgi:hypothetical protein
MDEWTILTVERLLDDLTRLRTNLRRAYPNRNSRVRSEAIKTQTAELAEAWMVEVAVRADVQAVLASDYLGDLTVHFQRLLQYSGIEPQRQKYDQEINAILRDSRLRLVVPLKQSRGAGEAYSPSVPAPQQRPVTSAFLAQSFAEQDASIAKTVQETLESLGLVVVTGERPRSGRISEKVKNLIDQQSLFVAVFTRRDKLAGKNEWTTSLWLIDEKAYAVGANKPLVLLRERGVANIGGIQGDSEYFTFDRAHLDRLVLYLIRLFDVTVGGLHN